MALKREKNLPYRPFSSSKDTHFQNEAKCQTFLVKISLYAWE